MTFFSIQRQALEKLRMIDISKQYWIKLQNLYGVEAKKNYT